MSDIAERPRATPLYYAVWRWHFIAGLLVLPFLVTMAFTGSIYLFKPELDHLLYRTLEDVPARPQSFMPTDDLVRHVARELNVTVLQITPAGMPDQAARLVVRDASGTALTAYADPYDGHVTGVTAYGGVMQLIRKIHSLQRFGFWASCLIELAAGWSIVLVGTGLFLWWPRAGAKGGIVTVRGTPGRRTFWRDLHAVTGLYSCAVILFLAFTGMPWSMFWGDHVQRWATAVNLGQPAPPAQMTPDWAIAANLPPAAAPHHHPGNPDLPWAMEQSEPPRSTDIPTRHAMDLDQAIQIFRGMGVDPSANISLPEGPQGAYVAAWRPDKVEDTRIVYLDQYTGGLLGDVRFKDWGPAAKAIEWGIAVHQGQQYGRLNRYIMLAGCIAIIMLATSAVTMWWKRRPARALGLPPVPDDPRVVRSLFAIVACVGVIFPLVGASLVVAAALEYLAAHFGRAPSAAA